jgi:HlyD family secretion protein
MKRPSRRIVIAAAVILVVLIVVVLVKSRRSDERYTTVAADRGDVLETVGATGALQAVVTVQVGSQVSGTIQELKADFNSTVKAQQVIVRLDPSSFEARVAQAQANVVAARANVEKSRTTIEDARQKYDRARELAQQELLPAADLETAKANYDGAQAQLEAAKAAVTQASAALKQAQVDLEHTVIRAPIDGVVIARNVDVGQTVAASLQAPTLFVIANDLSNMQVNASIDEADVGKVHTGQDVTFRVDAFPDRTFRGKIEQVRLQPTTTQNVVSYSTIVTAENPGGVLMPGMTASVSIIVSHREDVVRVPAAALRFRPSSAGRSPDAAPRTGDASARPRDGGDRAGGGGGGAGGGGGERGGGGGERRGRRERADGAAKPDAGRPGTVYVMGADGPEPKRITVGSSDGQLVEVKDGLAEGTRVITGVEGDAASGRSGQSGGAASSPFSPQFQRRQR